MATKKPMYMEREPGVYLMDNGVTSSEKYVYPEPIPGGGSEYVGPGASNAGAGRGKQGGASSKQGAGNRMSAAEKEMVEEARDAKAREKIKGMGFAKGGSISSASKRADGIAMRGKTKGTMVMCGGGKM